MIVCCVHHLSLKKLYRLGWVLGEIQALGRRG
uniref:Uncharacterized protein n=1 Tax=Arundo donax TaxID=35708 RepID=A0A0A9APQ4_ARUDO